MWFYVLAISAGAALGANARWLLGLWLNALFPALPLGTLAAWRWGCSPGCRRWRRSGGCSW